MTTKSYFLEAHFYSGGLRHHAYHDGDARPDWAPAADIVGFADEFPLDGGSSAIEVRRISAGTHEITWLGVYFRSVDATLGDRQNHAGVGVWLLDLIPTDVRSLLYGLSQLAMHLAQNIDAEALEKRALDFQSDAFLQHYVADRTAFPGGMPAADGQIVDTQLYYVRCAEGVGKCPLLADFLLAKLLLGDDAKKTARVLILAGTDETPRADAQKFKIITDEFDAPSKLATAIPVIAKSALDHSRKLEAELGEARKRMETDDAERAEVASLKKTYEKFSRDPLATVLDRIERLAGDVQNLAIRVDQQRAPPAVTNWGAHIPRPPRNPPAEPVEYEYNWVPIFGLVALGVIVIILIIYFVERFLP
jgi:hypothetical protein